MRSKPTLNPRKPWLIWCNQDQMRRTPPKADVAVISIVEPEDSFVVPEGFLEVLRLPFHDATDRDQGEFLLFYEEMAVKIIDFLKRNSDNNIMIHCKAGISRSAAVARFAADFLEREPVGWAVPTTQFANTFVLAILNRERWK